ncbi:ATP-binding protein [Butyrivibrio sp. AC2005]|uniref:ATP-binding protein n=1 Tax=Butyrivibrio sp. AC2005 TaxID=1280672 RepID=UPI0004107372|nr:ATP-binding protein [Butyrivibrio sp. AC2005]
MAKSIYEIKRIPDLTLSKYSALDEDGVDGVLKKHLSFLRQIHRQALLTGEIVHWIYEYNPAEDKGKRLKIYLEFDSDKSSAYVDNMVQNSVLAPYFDIVRVVPEEQLEGYKGWLSRLDEKELKKVVPVSMLDKYTSWMNRFRNGDGQGEKKRDKMDDFVTLHMSRINSYSHMSTLIKREKFSQADKKENGFFYSVNKWEINEDARLYNMFSMMQNMNMPCVYCVDVMPVDYTNKIEAPEMLGNVMFALRTMLTLRVEKSNNGTTSFQKDENADYTLNRYKDLIKEISENPHFQANIRVYADSEEYANMLLDAAASEALEKGSHDIQTLQGTFSIQDILNSKVLPVCHKNAPMELKFWPTLFTIEELKPFIVFPALYPGESIEIPKETAPGHDSSGLYLGMDSDGYEVFIPLKNLPKHAFLAGVPGSGKTNSMLHLATSLYQKQIPFLILEPAKQEYRALVNREEMKGITVFSPSSGTNFLLHINPFEFPTKMSLAEHIQNLINVFDGSFSMDPPMPFLLDRAIERVYRDKGWLPYMINNGTLPYPTMGELYKTLEKILDETDYEGEIKGNLKSVLQVRIGSLLSREMGDVFNVPFSTIAPEGWLKRSVVIELESMGSGPANFLTLMLSTLIRESLKANPMTRKEKEKTPVRHVIFFEEAHNLIGPKAEKDAGEGANPKIAATAFIVKMLAEVRALNEAIIIADQLPTAMAPEVIKNTSLKLGHRMTSADDRGLLGSTMSADEVQLERMSTFTQGKTLAIYEGLLKPFELQMHQWSKVNGVINDDLYTSPSNEDLYNRLCYENSPFIADMKNSLNITRDKIGAMWDSIIDDVAEFENDLNDRISFSEDLGRRIRSCEEKIAILEPAGWPKVSEEGKAKLLQSRLDYYESLDDNEAGIEMLKDKFNEICDQMEEIIFSLSSYKKQNRLFEEEIKSFVTEKLLVYRQFALRTKDICGFERSQEQKDRRTSLLKQWE